MPPPGVRYDNTYDNTTPGVRYDNTGDNTTSGSEYDQRRIEFDTLKDHNFQIQHNP